MDENNIEKGLELIGQEMNQKLLNTGKIDYDGKLLPIDLEEIEVGLIKIEEMHPLRKKRLGEVLPWLCCCFKGRNSKNIMFSEGKETGAIESVIEKELKETSERLDAKLQECGALPYGGSNFIQKEDDLKLPSQ